MLPMVLFFGGGALAAVSKVESHEPRWARHMFLKEASWADHYSVMARIKVALTFDTTDEVWLTSGRDHFAISSDGAICRSNFVFDCPSYSIWRQR